MKNSTMILGVTMFTLLVCVLITSLTGCNFDKPKCVIESKIVKIHETRRGVGAVVELQNGTIKLINTVNVSIGDTVCL